MTDHHEAGALWSAAPRMSDFEALMWRIEADARLRSDGIMLAVLDRTPDWDRVVATHAWAIETVPRLRQRVVDDPLRLRTPAWVDTDSDLAYHLTRVRLPDGTGMAGALDIAAGLHMAPFDTARPVWQAVLVEGLPGGKAAYLIKLHHALADATGFMQLFDILFARGPEPADDPQRYGVPARPDEPAESDRLAIVRDSVDATLGAARTVSGMTGRLLSRPGSVVDYVQSLGRVLKLPGTSSPLLANRGLARRVRTLECPLSDLKAAGKAAGGSLNDAYLAAMLGGLGSYHAKHGSVIGDIPTALPVSLRVAGDPAGGNKFAGAYIAGPAGEPDPARRIALVGERVRAVRTEPALDYLGESAGLLSRLPAQLVTAITLRVSNSLDIQASNFPGLTRPAYLAGAHLERMYPFGPVPGSAMMATLATHEGICCIGVTTDNQAVPDPDLLNSCMQESLDEVLGLAGGQK
jgi:WS/DGAT/MGAT family acyltransferase